MDEADTQRGNDPVRDGSLDGPDVRTTNSVHELGRGRDAPPVDLVDTITHQVIPRLLLAHRMDVSDIDRIDDARRPPTHQEVLRLVDTAVAQDVQSCLGQAEAMLRDGISLESLLLDWISAAACKLGDGWLEDERSFADVTLGLGTLHRMLATLRHRLTPPIGNRGLVVLTVPPGEQHILAIHVLGDLLRNAGWEAVVEPTMTEDELVTIVSTESVAMVGISMSSHSLIEPTRRLVTRIREASLNRDLAVMLGGPVDLSEAAKSMGAVACGSAREALSWLGQHGRVVP